MARRFTDTNIWTDQEWFIDLSPEHKFAWLYIKDHCDHGGIWKISVSLLKRHTGLKSFNLNEFISEVNKDYDDNTGDSIEVIRLKRLDNNELWLTKFVQFQYENKESKRVNPNGNFAKSAIGILRGRGILNEAISKGFLTLTEDLLRDKEDIAKGEGKGKGKGKGKGNNNKNVEIEIEEIFEENYKSPEDQLLDDEIWFEQNILMRHPTVPDEEFQKSLSQWSLKVISEGDDHKPLKQLRAGFTKWMSTWAQNYKSGTYAPDKSKPASERFSTNWINELKNQKATSI